MSNVSLFMKQCRKKSYLRSGAVLTCSSWKRLVMRGLGSAWEGRFLSTIRVFNNLKKYQVRFGANLRNH